MIDPFDIYRLVSLDRINTTKSAGAPRFFKPLQVSARQPRVVFLGSSRTQVGLDPADMPGSYNLGIPGILATELRGFGEHVLADTGAEHLIIGLDIFTFNDDQLVRGDYDASVRGKYALLRAIPETLLSFTALEQSRKTFRRSRKNRATGHTRDGQFLMPNPPGQSSEAAMLRTARDFMGAGGSYRDFKSIERSLGELDMLLAAAKAKGVRVDLFISPTHATLLEALDVAGLWKTYETWKRRLVEIAVRHQAAIWDFGGYNRFSTAPLSAAQNAFIDASHYRPAIGKHLLAAIGGNPSEPSFGTRLTPENIDTELSQQRRARKAYRMARPEDVMRIRIAACAGKFSGKSLQRQREDCGRQNAPGRSPK